MAYGRISSYHHSGLKHFLPLNNLFLSLASCSASLPSSKPALSKIHDIISQLWLSNLDYCANKKRPDSGGDCSMWKMWLEVRNPSKLMCISKKCGQNRMECSCRFHSAYCHRVRGGCKYISPIYCTALCAHHHPRSVVQVLPVSFQSFHDPCLCTVALLSVCGGCSERGTPSAEGESLCCAAALHPLGSEDCIRAVWLPLQLKGSQQVSGRSVSKAGRVQTSPLICLPPGRLALPR